MRVLLVEDEMLLRRIAGAMLGKNGCQVTLAGNGEEALAHLGAPWDLVLMDCQMPVLDGLEATRLWRARETGHTLIVALSAATSDEERELGLEAGMDDFVSKPLSPDKIARLLALAADHQLHYNAEALPPPLPAPLALLREEYAGYEALLWELARGFEAELGPLWSRLGELCARGDAEAIFQAAHALKGKALSLHLHDFSAQLGPIEGAARRGELSLCRDLKVAAQDSAEHAQEQVHLLLGELEKAASPAR